MNVKNRQLSKLTIARLEAGGIVNASSVMWPTHFKLGMIACRVHLTAILCLFEKTINCGVYWIGDICMQPCDVKCNPLAGTIVFLKDESSLEFIPVDHIERPSRLFFISKLGYPLSGVEYAPMPAATNIVLFV